ncbi:MAG: hypothetical protein FWG94_09880 [Oscillospiraceae bacterium]|nr:hypothetical protein [Oscillospiraceae bacterium]
MGKYDHMLSMGLESFRTLQEENKLTVLSTLDTLTLDSMLPGDVDIQIYAEDITINSQVMLKNACISAHQIQWDCKTDIDLSGKNGEDAKGINMDPAVIPGASGEDGSPGGNLFIYMESGQPDDLLPPVVSEGGAGGRGQEGTSKSAGGDGGNGGNGGNVYILYKHPLTQILQELEFAYSLKGPEKKQKLEELIDRIDWDEPCYRSMKRHIDQYKKDKKVEACIIGLSSGIAIMMQTTHSNFKISVNGGAYGTYGDGTPSGKNGEWGKTGAKDIIRFSKLSALTAKVLPPAKPVHSAQCRMLLEKAKIMYFAMRNENMQDVAYILQKLVERTEVFRDLNSKNPILDLYCDDSRGLAELQSIHMEASGLLNNLKNGLDYFGNDARFVPLASFAFYNGIQKELINNFKIIEDAFHKYYEALKHDKSSMDVLKTIAEQLGENIKNKETEMRKLKADLFSTSEQINSYQGQTSYLKDNLVKKIDDFKEIIAKHFTFSLKDAQMALSTLVNSPTSAQKWVDTFLKMGGSKLENINDDIGKEVNRKYIINKMKSVSGNISSIIISFKQEYDGSIAFDELSACKLLASESDLFGMLNAFYEQFPGALAELKKCFSEYVSAVVSRNSQIILYNTICSSFIQVSSELKSNRQKLEKVKQEEFQKLNPNLPEVAALVSQMYYMARCDLMETMTLTARAYRLWSLNDENIISKMYKNNPSELNHSFFVKHQSDFIKAYQTAVEQFGRNASAFPARRDQRGIEVELTQAQTELLKINHTVFVTINPALFQTSKLENPFYGYYNIRIGNVRVWADGAKTSDDKLHIGITHTGSSHYVNAYNQLLTFRHNPVSASFQYKTDTKEIFREGDMGWTDDEKKYALTSPFTTWKISIRNENNIGLDLSKLSKIVMEFHGKSYPMP